MLLLNPSTVKAEVRITTPDGPDFVHIQPKGRVRLDADHKVDQNWVAVHCPFLKQVDDTPVAKAVAATKAVTPPTKAED